jgi:MFS family permease
MRIPAGLLPSDSVTSAEVAGGLRMLLFDGICTQAMLVLSGGAFLVAYALLLGASNKVIGLLFAVPWAAQMLQLPSTVIVQRVGLRKALVVLTAGVSRAALISMAAVPWIIPRPQRLTVLVVSLALFWGIGAVGGCAFSPWMRDLVPDRVRGRYFGKRLTAAVAVGAAVSMLAGIGVDAYRARVTPEIGAYTILLAIAAAAGFLGVGFLTRIPEPRMTRTSARGIGATIAEPLRDRNFRKLLLFLGTWNFSVNLAVPFFAVYMLTKLGLSMTWIMALFLTSQAAIVAFLNIWGRLADRLSNKSVLAAAGPLFMVSTILWPVASLQTSPALTLALLVLIHLLAGISTAGVMLCGWNVALKLAPRASSTGYLATNALVFGAAASVAPILAGLGLDWAAAHHVSVALGGAGRLGRVSLDGLDFLFMASFVSGAVALRLLARVEERGGVQEKEMFAELYAEIRATARSLSSVAGLRALSSFPYGLARLRAARRSGGGEDDPEAPAPPESP